MGKSGSGLVAMVLACGCGLVLDLSPEPADAGAADDARVADAGGSAEMDGGSTGVDDGSVPAIDAGGATDSGTAARDGALEDGGATAADGGIWIRDGATLPCDSVDCDDDGTIEHLVTDPSHCGACFNACGSSEICCNGRCTAATTCDILC